MGSMFTWKANYDLGVDAMNDEHKTLIALMDRLYQEHENGAAYETLANTIDELGAYTVKHFKDEEEFMESIEFPDLKVHKLIHEDLLKKFARHVETFKTSREIDPNFFNFLQLWLSAHIQGIDMKYADHSKSHAA